jgi:VanZ family protein
VLFVGRNSSLLDVWVDGFSSLTGILLVWILQRRGVTSRIHRFWLWLLKDNPYALGAFATALIYLCGAIFPFNAIPYWGYIKDQFRFENLTTFLSADWQDPQLWIKSLFTFFLYVFFSYLTFIAFVYQRKQKKNVELALFWTLSLSLVLITACEFLQIFFPPPYFEISQILVATFAGFFGAGLGYLERPFVSVPAYPNIKSGRRLADTGLLIAMGLLTILVLFDWLRPFHTAANFRELAHEMKHHMLFVPFEGYNQTFFWSFEGFFRKFFLLWGWSTFFSLWITERFGHIRINPLLAGLSTGLVTFVLEIFQIFIVGRYFSLTDVWWGCVAGFFGGSFSNLILRAETETPLPKTR